MLTRQAHRPKACLPVAIAPGKRTHLAWLIVAALMGTPLASAAPAQTDSAAMRHVSHSEGFCARGKHALRYSLTDLGSFFEGLSTYAFGVNSAGQVTGGSNVDSDPLAFLYDDGTLENLNPSGAFPSVGRALNAAGQVAGWARFGSVLRGFLYYQGTVRDLGDLGDPESDTVANGINSRGQVTGYSHTTEGAIHAFVYSRGTMRDLGTLPGMEHSEGRALNAAGEVTGSSFNTPDSRRAFLYRHGRMRDLGTLGGTDAIGFSINSAGQIAGYSRTEEGNYHAFLYGKGKMRDLGTLGGTDSRGYAINSSAHVTGTSLTSAGTQHAFLYCRGTMTDLNDVVNPSSPFAPYVTLVESFGISNNGLIIANGTDSRLPGLERAYLLTPNARRH